MMEDHHVEIVDLLAAWLPRQRWFAGKGRPVGSLRIVADIRVDRDGAPGTPLRVFVVEVRYGDGGRPDHYQVPLIVRPEAPFGHEAFLVGESSAGLVYDGLHDPDGSGALLDFIRRGASGGGLSATALETLEKLPAHAVGAEQSNTSIVYGESYILKVFRRLWPGVNPDLEMTRALAGAGSSHVARPLAWLTGQLDGVPTTFAFMQEYLRTGTEGWLLALTSVRDLFNEGDLHADEVGGDFAAEATRLGAATAEVHRDLAASLPTRPADAAALGELAAHMRRRLDAALASVPELAPFADDLRAVYDAVPAAEHPAPLQRIHGDLHLGQVLRVETGWVLFDFEGEPARPVEERTRLDSPLRDVAGMLRSFDYAAQSMLLERPDEPALPYRAQEWAQRNADAFCHGYGTVAGADPREHGPILRAFELDKAVYEVLYEARHRPSWISIPLQSVERLTRPQTRIG